jgi:hypothetical protein
MITGQGGRSVPRRSHLDARDKFGKSIYVQEMAAWEISQISRGWYATLRYGEQICWHRNSISRVFTLLAPLYSQPFYSFWHF